jgi:hypothetical protein
MPMLIRAALDRGQAGVFGKGSFFRLILRDLTDNQDPTSGPMSALKILETYMDSSTLEPRREISATVLQDTTSVSPVNTPTSLPPTPSAQQWQTTSSPSQVNLPPSLPKRFKSTTLDPCTREVTLEVLPTGPRASDGGLSERRTISCVTSSPRLSELKRGLEGSGRVETSLLLGKSKMWSGIVA